jgi:hypothetical protein
MTTTSQGYSSSSVQVTIEQLRYWVPTISDVARVAEDSEGDGWKLSLEPRVAAACPVAITLHDTGRFDLVIGGETYVDRALDRLDQIVQFLERVTDGNVIQRHWVSAATGVPQGIQTIVKLGPGVVWRDGMEPDGGFEHHDRHFLPYRRI